MHIHLIGVAGTAMATLAANVATGGAIASLGSDAGVYPPMSDFLRAERIEVSRATTRRTWMPPPDLVVVGNAISRGNVELEAVLDRRQRYCSLPGADSRRVLVGLRFDRVSGHARQDHDHGMVAWVLTHAGLDPRSSSAALPATSTRAFASAPAATS